MPLRSAGRGLACAALLLASALTPVRGAPSRSLVVFLCPGLTADDLSRTDMPRLRALAERGAIGLMNVAAPRRDTGTALLTLALGEHTPADASDDDVWRADAGSADEGVAAGVAFARRTGLPIPAPDRVVHLGIGALTRRGENARLLGARLPDERRWVLVTCGDVRARLSAGILLTRADGLGPPVERLGAPPGAADPHEPGAGALVVCRTVADVEAVLTADRLSPDADVVVCPLPSPDGTIGRKRLPAIVCAGPSWPRGVLSSATTRTPGLVANIDLAPTLLAHEGVIPDPGGPGHPWISEPTARPDRLVRHLDRVVAVNESALVPVFGSLGAVCAFAAFGGLYRRARGGSARRFRVVTLALLTMPLAMLVAVPFGCETLPALAATIAGLMALLGAAAWSMTRRNPLQGPPLIFVATAAVILIDAAFGLGWVQFSMLSSYQLQGIRYYGIGNEYMGVLIGCALFAVSSGTRLPWARIALLACAWAALGHPALGAKAGGVVVGAAALGVGIAVVRGRRPRWRELVGWTAVGIGAAFAVAWLDRAASGEALSHMGGALASAQTRGAAYLAEIVLRKLAMNARIATNPIMLGAAMLAACAMWLAAHRVDASGGPWAGAPVRRNGFRAAAMVALVALLFNDSGAVAAIFVLGPFIMGYLHDLFAVPSADGKEPDASAPNPTNA